MKKKIQVKIDNTFVGEIFLCMYLCAPSLGILKFTIFISSTCIALFITVYCSSLSLVTVFVVKYILSDIDITTPVFLSF